MGQTLEEAPLTDGDRLYARLWCYTYKKEPKLLAHISEYPDRWAWSMSWGDEDEPPHKLPQILIKAMENTIFTGREAAEDALALALRELRRVCTLPGELG